MKVKTSPKKVVLVVFLLLLICTSVYVYIETKPVKIIDFGGYRFEFRDDVKAADKVPLFSPSEEYPRYMFETTFTPKIDIVYLESDNSTTNSLYALAGFELTYKLSLIGKSKGLVKIFNATPTNTTVKPEPEPGTLRILLIPPEFTDKTQVIVGENEIRIYGKNARDFDLAVIKAILVLSGIDVKTVARPSLF